ncbi:hypothetical protein NC651_000521 [Populus alba x Populus x berolinensis]|nr:hypothetical protein NC651_000521 [Populus alba x Populus x berolinensis]
MVFTPVGDSGGWILLPLSGCKGIGFLCAAERGKEEQRGAKICLPG